MVSKVYDRSQIRSLYVDVVVDGMDPEIQQDVHFGTFTYTDQLIDFCDWKKEKPGVLLTRVTISENRIFRFPVQD